MESGLEDIPLAELIERFIEADRVELHVCLPAKVEAFNASKQTVDVTLQFNRAVRNGQDDFVSEALPKLSDVPIGFTRGGGFFVSVPIAVGDFGMVICAERNLGAWRQAGNQGDPGDLGMHTLDGAWFVPAVAPDANALQNVDANNMVIGSDSTPGARIVIKPSGEIDLGSDANRFAARADKVITYLNLIIGWLAGCTPSGTETGLAAIKALATTQQGVGEADVACANVKVE